ncbi:MAG: dephospho-CoA kinase [Endomicrobium sp.]|jgi:dephospho-CoA kinase|nr:dephospho-CoA kinase [Endomicrobium sp.]
MIIGLTGSIAGGKTTSAKFLKQLGMYTIDADKIAHDLTNLDSPVLYEVLRVFGTDILYENGTLNRKKLAYIIFSDNYMKLKLEKILHKHIVFNIERKIRCNINKYKNILLDVPLLFETGLHNICDLTIVIYTSYQYQIKRLMCRDNLSYEQINKRIINQFPITSKMQLADVIVNNLGSKKDLKKKMKRLYKLFNS